MRLAKVLTLADFGSYSFGMFLVNFLVVLASFGIGNTIEAWFYIAKKNKWLNELITFSIFFPLLLSIFVALFLFFFSLALDVDVELLVQLSFLLVSKVLYSVVQRFNSISKSVKVYVTNEFIYFLIYLIQILLLLSADSSYGRIYIYQAIALFFPIVIVLMYSFKDVKYGIGMSRFRMLFHYSLPVLGHSGLHAVLGFGDKWLVKTKISAQADLGSYNFAFQIGEIQNLLTMMLNRSLNPYLYDRSGTTKETKVLFLKVSYLTSLLTFSVLSLFAPFYLELYLGDKFSESYVLMILVFFGYALNMVYFSSLPDILSVDGDDSRSSRILLKLSIRHFLLSISIGIPLIWYFGAMGGAVFFVVYKGLLALLASASLSKEVRVLVLRYLILLCIMLFVSLITLN